MKHEIKLKNNVVLSEIAGHVMLGWPGNLLVVTEADGRKREFSVVIAADEVPVVAEWLLSVAKKETP